MKAKYLSLAIELIKEIVSSYLKLPVVDIIC